MAAGARNRALRRDRRSAGDQTFFAYRLLDADNIRNKPPGGGALYDIGCYAILTARYVFGAEPTRVVASLDVDPKFGTDRLTSALIEFPGGRQSDLHLRHPDPGLSAGDDRRRGRPRRGRRSFQCPHRPTDAHHCR